ncbi:MAG TPA: hypothetical protein VJ805_11095 [Nitrospiraceae bacterium]|nr:hypothetical protein [Nitrospiraceae bacterium]
MSAPIVRIGDLEINQDLRVQEQMWKIQRIGWAAMALIVLLGVAGLFGHGPASRASAGNKDDPLWIEYERFGRHQGSSELRFHVRAADPSKPISIWIGPDYAAHVDIRQIMPPPVRTTLADQGFTFEVAAADPQEPGVVTLLLEFRGIGRLNGEIRSPGAEPVHIWQLIYP